MAGTNWNPRDALAAAGGGTSAQDALTSLLAKSAEFRTFEDFGAVGDYSSATDSGTDDTTAIQAALDWAHADGTGRPRALLMTGRSFLCGQITTHPCTTIIGSGRHTSAFWCKSGTAGKWWSDRGNGAQKLMLSGMAFYGRNQERLSHVCEFGDEGVQFGSEGILQGLWLRDAPNACALMVNANVGICRDLTLQSCKIGLKTLGNANHYDNIFVMQMTDVGADISGGFVRGLHVEATSSHGLPLRLNGDSHIRDLCISTASATAFAHLIDVDATHYDEWSIHNVQLLGSAYEIRRGILKIGSTYSGGTNPTLFTGASYLKAIAVNSGELSIKGQIWQAFAISLTNDNGIIKHRIGSLGDSSLASNFASAIRGAKPIFTATPKGMRATFSAGGRISEAAGSTFILDTRKQVAADQTMQGVVQTNSTGTIVNAWVRALPQKLDDVAEVRLVIQFTDAATGTPFPLTKIPPGKAITVGVSGFLA